MPNVAGHVLAIPNNTSSTDSSENARLLHLPLLVSMLVGFLLIL